MEFNSSRRTNQPDKSKSERPMPRSGQKGLS